MMLRSCAAFFISFSVTFFIVPWLQKLALKKGIVDIPDGRVKQHQKTTPYLGGVAVYLGFVTASIITTSFLSQYPFFYIGLTILLGLGLIDDITVISPKQKFLGQCAACLCLVYAGAGFSAHFFTDLFNTPSFISIFSWLAIPLSVWWLASLINAFNLIDVMDGLATSVAIVATVSYLAIAIILQIPEMIVLSSFLGGLVAFFYYNKPLASIYLGDTGSLFIGGFLGSIPFFFGWGKNFQGWSTALVPFLILSIPIIELCTLIVVRTVKGIPFYNASPHHFSLYLKSRKWSVKNILFYTGSFGFFWGMLGCLLFFKQLNGAQFLFLTGFSLSAWVAIIFYGAQISSIIICCFLRFPVAQFFKSMK